MLCFYFPLAVFKGGNGCISCLDKNHNVSIWFFKVFDDYNLCWALSVHMSFSDFNFISRSRVHQKDKTAHLSLCSQLNLPMNTVVPGTELTKEPFRWDQRIFGLVLRLPGSVPPDVTNFPYIPSAENSPIDVMCEVTGGKPTGVLKCLCVCMWVHMNVHVYECRYMWA